MYKTSGRIYNLILQLLKENKEFRSSDKKLQWEIWRKQGYVNEYGLLSQSSFLSYGIASTETIRRTRQKIQELHPELRGSLSTKKLRMLKEKEKGTFIYRENICIFVPEGRGSDNPSTPEKGVANNAECSHSIPILN